MPDPAVYVDFLVRKNEIGPEAAAVTGTLKKLTANLRAVSGTARNVFLGGSVAIAGFIKSLSDSEMAEARLDSAIKATGNAAGVSTAALKEQANEIQRLTTFEDDAVTSAQAMLVSYGKIGGEIMPRATQAIVDFAAAMKIDLGSATQLVGRAIASPAQGIQALARAGVRFTAEQKILVAQMVDSGRVMEAQEYILRELNSRFQGTAEAVAKTSGGKIIQLKNQFGDLAEEIGGALAPAIGGLIDRIREVLPGITEWVKHNQGLVGGLAVAGVGMAGFLALLTPLGDGLTAVNEAFKLWGSTVKAMPAILKSIDFHVKVLSGTLLDVVSDPIILGLAAVAAGLTYLQLKADAVASAMNKAYKSTQDFAKGLGAINSAQRIDDQLEKQTALAAAYRNQAALLRETSDAEKAANGAGDENAHVLLRQADAFDALAVRAEYQVELMRKSAEASEAHAAAKRSEAEAFEQLISPLYLESALLQKSGEQALILKGIIGGLSEADAKLYASLTQENEANKKANETRDEAIRSLQEQRSELELTLSALREGKSIEEIKLFDASNVEYTRKEAERTLGVLKEVTEETKKNEALKRAAAKDQSDSEALHERNLTEAERRARDIARATELRDRGKISADDFKREINRINASTEAAPAPVIGFESVASAFDRIASAAATRTQDDPAVAVAENTAAIAGIAEEQVTATESQTQVLSRKLDDVNKSIQRQRNVARFA